MPRICHLLVMLGLSHLAAAQDAPRDSTASMSLATVEEAPKWPGCEALAGIEAGTCTDEGVMRHVVKETRYPNKARQKVKALTSLRRLQTSRLAEYMCRLDTPISQLVSGV